jgi:hypothetical protein
VVALCISLACWIDKNQSHNAYFLEEMLKVYSKKAKAA